MPNTTIMDVVNALCVKQLALTITSPLAVSIKAAHNLPPNRASALPDLPCWVNAWQMAPIEWGLDVIAGPRHEFYTIRSQLFVDDADTQQAALIATQFLNPFILALRADYTLGGLVQQVDLRGGEPTLVLLEWAGQSYPGLDLFVDVEMNNR